MLSEIFLNSRNETHLARVSIFVHLVTDLSIYSISFILFYFILFYFTLFIIFYRRSDFFITFFFIYFVIICPVPGCSGMFRNVPGCSGMFHVPGFVNARLVPWLFLGDGGLIEIVSESRRQFTFVDSSIVKGPIRLRDSRGQNLAADTNSCERLYQALH